MEAQFAQCVLLWVAAVTAGGAGWSLWRTIAARQQRIRYRQVLQRSMGQRECDSPESAGKSDVAGRVVGYLCQLSYRMGAASFKGLSPPAVRRSFPVALVRSSGLQGQITPEAYGEARVRLTLALAAVGGAAGLLVSAEFGLIASAAGACAGWRAPPWALGRRSGRRAREMERHLSEMLDVMALGLRSGLSFERSLELYVRHFSTLLAASFALAHRQWTSGLALREDALREVASSYASPLLDRTVENVIRSLRFGSSLADNLEDAAREARASYRSRKQEQVAKAPVKMMVPTGMLILPAMLMMVLGPVLLELIAGF